MPYTLAVRALVTKEDAAQAADVNKPNVPFSGWNNAPTNTFNEKVSEIADANVAPLS